jgi:hypothetical protein
VCVCVTLRYVMFHYVMLRVGRTIPLSFPLAPPTTLLTLPFRPFCPLQACLKECCKGVTRELQGSYKVLQECYKGVTRVLQECYKSVTRVLQECYKSVTCQEGLYTFECLWWHLQIRKVMCSNEKSDVCSRTIEEQ